MEIKNVIRDRRLELGLTYEELGKMIGVGKSTVRKWETGMIENIKRDNIVSLAKALNVSPALIMGWDINEIQDTKKVELTKDEVILLDTYKELNDLGKKEATKRVAELRYMPMYNNDHLTAYAAHAKDGATEEDIKHDDDLMNNDSLWND